MKRALFLKIGAFSNINQSVISQLKNNFPDFEIDILDINDLVKQDLFSLTNKFYLAKEYGIDILQRKKYWRDWAIVTSYLFKLIKKKLHLYANGKNYTFTFQTQSLFDGSIEGIPHFLYTDSTVLANRQYPGLEPETYMKSAPWMKFEKQIYQNAAVNFTFSQNQSDSIINDYGIDASRVVCVYAGSNTPPPAAQSHNYGTKNILFVGVNWERKGGPVLEQAFKQVLAKHPDASLTIVGCSPTVNTPNTHIIGRIPLQQVEAYYNKATIFCMPTRQEPFGIAFIEAMQRRLPVVSSTIGAVPEIIINNKSGLLYHPDNVKGFADGLTYLLDNPSVCAEFGETGYHRYEEYYTWDNSGKRMKAIIDGIINS
jgi:glycosyltransferase involved in cell wall biosynthesis